jgi:hypothetical protein
MSGEGGGFAPAMGGGSMFPSDDGLAKMADLFVGLAGSELNQAGVQALMFLQGNGSSDIAVGILKAKRHMTSAHDIKDIIEKLSPAQHAKDMLAAQTEARSSMMR